MHKKQNFKNSSCTRTTSFDEDQRSTDCDSTTTLARLRPYLLPIIMSCFPGYTQAAAQPSINTDSCSNTCVACTCTLTSDLSYDLKFSSHAIYAHDPYTCEKSRSKTSWFKRQWKQTNKQTKKQMDRQTDRHDRSHHLHSWSTKCTTTASEQSSSLHVRPRCHIRPCRRTTRHYTDNIAARSGRAATTQTRRPRRQSRAAPSLAPLPRPMSPAASESRAAGDSHENRTSTNHTASSQ